jgi:hypothetical protein
MGTDTSVEEPATNPHLWIQMKKKRILAMLLMNALSIILDTSSFSFVLRGFTQGIISSIPTLTNAMMQLRDSRTTRIRSTASSKRLLAFFRENSSGRPCVRDGFDDK